MSLTFIDENGIEKKPIDFGLAVLPNHEHEAIPETIDRTLSIPEKDGLLYYGSNLGAREFNIPMIVIPQDNRVQVQAKIREFASFMFNGYGKPKKVKLIFDYEPDKFYYVRFSGRVVPDRLYRMAEFGLPIVAYDPYAYSLVTNDEVTWGSTLVTFNSSYLMGHEGGETYTITTPQTINVVVSGSQNVSPVFTLSGSGDNVEISANGKSFSLGSFTSTDWVIDGGTYTVKKNGITDFLVDNFLELHFGDNDVTVTGSNLNLTLQITFRDKYL
jgi:predicted phage tail component-like protein